MSVRLTADQAATKHATRLKAATQDIRDGVARVTESPTEKAAQQADKMLSRLTEAVQSGKWAAGLRRVTLEQWKSQMSNVGVGRIAAGIDAAHDKQVSFFRDLFAHENQLMTTIDAMPDLTLEDSIQRSAAWIRGMAEFRRSS